MSVEFGEIKNVDRIVDGAIDMLAATELYAIGEDTLQFGDKVADAKINNGVIIKAGKNVIGRAMFDVAVRYDKVKHDPDLAYNQANMGELVIESITESHPGQGVDTALNTILRNLEGIRRGRMLSRGKYISTVRAVEGIGSLYRSEAVRLKLRGGQKMPLAAIFLNGTLNSG